MLYLDICIIYMFACLLKWVHILMVYVSLCIYVPSMGRCIPRVVPKDCDTLILDLDINW